MLEDVGRKWRVTLFILICYMTAAIIVSETRSLVLAIIAGSVPLALLHPALKGKRLAFILGSWGLILTLTLMTAPRFINRILLGFGYKGELLFTGRTGDVAATVHGVAVEGITGYSIRFAWWKNGLQEMWANPVKFFSGLGMGGFTEYFGGAPKISSIYLAFFFDLGIVAGPVVFAALVYLIFRRVYFAAKYARRTYTYRMMVAAVTGLVIDTGIHGLIDYDFSSYGSKNPWIMLALTVAIFNLVKAENQAASLPNGGPAPNIRKPWGW
jgi:hypothetical protein